MSTTPVDDIREQIYYSTYLLFDLINIIVSYTPEAYCDIALSAFELQWIKDHPINKLLFQQKVLKLHEKLGSCLLIPKTAFQCHEILRKKIKFVHHLIETHKEIITPYSIKPLEITNLDVPFFQTIIKSQEVEKAELDSDIHQIDSYSSGDELPDLTPDHIEDDLKLLTKLCKQKDIYDPNEQYDSTRINDFEYVMNITKNLITKDNSYQEYKTRNDKLDWDPWIIRYNHKSRGIILPIEYSRDLLILRLQLVSADERREKVGLIISTNLRNESILPTGEIAVISNSGVLYVKYKEWSSILNRFFITHMDKILPHVLHTLGQQHHICLNCGIDKSLPGRSHRENEYTCKIPWTLFSNIN